MTAVADVEVMFRLLAGMMVQGLCCDLWGEPAVPSRRPRKERMELAESGGVGTGGEVTGLLATDSTGSGAQELRDDA